MQFFGAIFGPIFGFGCSISLFLFGVGGLISNVGCGIFRLNRRGAQLCASTYTWPAGLVSGLWLAGRVGTVGWLWLVRRVGGEAMQILLVAGLGRRGGQLCVPGLVSGLGLVGRVGSVGKVGLVRRVGGVAVLNVVVALSVLRGRRVQLSVLV